MTTRLKWQKLSEDVLADFESMREVHAPYFDGWYKEDVLEFFEKKIQGEKIDAVKYFIDFIYNDESEVFKANLLNSFLDYKVNHTQEDSEKI